MYLKTLLVNFNIAEYLIFPTWQKADKEEKLRIVKKLGEIEGKMIINEIKLKVKNHIN